MKFKITNIDYYSLEDCLKNVLDVMVTIIRNSIPTKEDIEFAEGKGTYWIKENNRYNLYSSVNNYWLYIKEKKDDYIIVDFSIRYDLPDFLKTKSMIDCLLVWFDNIEKIDEKV